MDWSRPVLFLLLHFLLIIFLILILLLIFILDAAHLLHSFYSPLITHHLTPAIPAEQACI
jgi:hypothetical protein